MECRERRVALIALILLLPLPAAAITGLMIWQYGQVAGWYVGCGLVLLWLWAWRQVLSRSVVLIIDDVGIEDRRNGLGIIPWEDILRIEEEYGQDQPNIRIHVVEPEKYLAILPWWRRAMNPILRPIKKDVWVISCLAVEPGEEVIWAYLRKHHGVLTGMGRGTGEPD